MPWPCIAFKNYLSSKKKDNTLRELIICCYATKKFIVKQATTGKTTYRTTAYPSTSKTTQSVC